MWFLDQRFSGQPVGSGGLVAELPRTPHAGAASGIPTFTKETRRISEKGARGCSSAPSSASIGPPDGAHIAIDAARGKTATN